MQRTSEKIKTNGKTIHRPDLSVVIATYNAEKTIGACLQSLMNQLTEKSYEVIVIDSSSDGTASIVKSRFQHVNLYTCSERKYSGEARNRGISLARSDLIACTDGDCIVGQNWVEEIIRAHQSSDWIIAGSIANKLPSNLVGWASYFCEFSHWMGGTEKDQIFDAAGANVSYKKQLFSQMGGYISGTYCSDTDFHWRLLKAGYRIRFVPDIMVFHHSIDDFFRYIKHEYIHGRSFARIRCAAQRLSPLKQTVLIVFAFLIPCKLMTGILFRVLKKHEYVLPFIRSCILLFWGLVTWSMGECVGYIYNRTNTKSS